MPKAIIKIDSEVHEIECSKDLTILETALEAGINPPFGCMSGACHACMAHLESGEVDPGDDSFLEDDEKARGMILTCQSRPKSGEISLRYQNN